MLNREHCYVTAVIAIIFGISSVCYGRFVNNYFAYDDFAIMEHVIRGPAAVLQGYNYILRLVANAIHWPLYYGFGLNPLGYNLFCLALHTGNAVILFFLVRMLFGNQPLAALSAILFAGSSVGCDAIFWKAAYATPLNLAFYLLTLMAYVKYRREDHKKYLVLSVVLFIMATLSKEEAASLPFVILLTELFVLKSKCNLKLICRAVPYVTVIVTYLLVNYIIIYQIFMGKSELVRLSSFRPLHTLLSCWTVFFMPPQGRLDGQMPAMVVTGILLTATLILAKDRRLALFAIGWIFVTFLPQSLSNLSQFEPKYIFNSISRHLYLPSVGASLVLAMVIMQLRNQLGSTFGRLFSMVAVVVFLCFNYGRIQERGSEWALEGRPIKNFLAEIGKMIPVFPANSHFYVEEGPTGRAYMQLALRAYYRNPTLWWIVDPDRIKNKPDEPVFMIRCDWYDRDQVTLVVNRLN